MKEGASESAALRDNGLSGSGRMNNLDGTRTLCVRMLAQFFLLSCLSILIFIASPCAHLAELAENFHVRKQLRMENSCGHGMKSCAPSSSPPSSSPSLFSASVLVASDSDTCLDDRLSDDVWRLVLSSMFQCRRSLRRKELNVSRECFECR